jgi:serine/threonine-protein kinase
MKSPNIIISILLVCGLSLISKTPIKAQSTAVPISYITFPTANIGEFVVPDSNPKNVSAYGGRLTRYDVHVAKMFEITHYECRNQSGRLQKITWRYYAANKQRSIGAFEISCSLANRIASEYGFMSNSEPTEILYYRAEAVVDIPVLAITGEKVDSWLGFLTTFRPEGMD